MPIGQLAGVDVERQGLLDLVDQVERVAASRSILLTKVMIGTSRSRHTSNSLRVCSSMPLRGVDHHDRAVDRGQRAVGVLAEILVAGGVEQVEDEPVRTRRSSPPTKPRCRARARSSSSPSGCAARSPRALTSPASWIAPPNSSSFSVSVVLPASGCEMIAKVRRRAISPVISLGSVAIKPCCQARGARTAGARRCRLYVAPAPDCQWLARFAGEACCDLPDQPLLKLLKSAGSINQNHAC